MFDLTNGNISYYTIPAAFALCFLPSALTMVVAGKNYDLAYPRRTGENCAKDASLDKETTLLVQRASAASANGFETVGFYAAAVVAANTAGVPAETVNALSIGYVASRALYNVIYVALQRNRKLAPLRSLTWMLGVGLTFTLFIKAGNAMP